MSLVEPQEDRSPSQHVLNRARENHCHMTTAFFIFHGINLARRAAYYRLLFGSEPNSEAPAELHTPLASCFGVTPTESGRSTSAPYSSNLKTSSALSLRIAVCNGLPKPSLRPNIDQHGSKPSNHRRLGGALCRSRKSTISKASVSRSTAQLSTSPLLTSAPWSSNVATSSIDPYKTARESAVSCAKPAFGSAPCSRSQVLAGSLKWKLRTRVRLVLCDGNGGRCSLTRAPAAHLVPFAR